MEGVKLLKTISQTFLYHVPSRSFNHAEGASCVDNKHMRDIFVEKIAFSLFLSRKFEVSIICKCVPRYGSCHVLTLDFLHHLLREKFLVKPVCITASTAFIRVCIAMCISARWPLFFEVFRCDFFNLGLSCAQIL